jgi:uncharacterized caspase-like protein
MDRRTLLLAIAAGMLLPLTGHAEPGEKRLALVIGNSKYRKAPLKNPVNDAQAMTRALRGLGFTVMTLEDGSLREMIAALQRFSIRARDFNIRLIFYAGHGLQIRGRNYLIPIEANMATEEDITRNGADVGDVLDRLSELRGGLNIVILDACRNNPFNNLPALDADGRRITTRAPLKQGLAKIEPPSGTIVAYSTAPGAVAIDSASQKNSVYTRHLLKHIAQPGVPIEMMFKRVRSGVAQETQQLQMPWEASSMTGDFCFAMLPEQFCGV